jgi:hypothetical protein
VRQRGTSAAESAKPTVEFLNFGVHLYTPSGLDQSTYVALVRDLDSTVMHRVCCTGSLFYSHSSSSGNLEWHISSAPSVGHAILMSQRHVLLFVHERTECDEMAIK